MLARRTNPLRRLPGQWEPFAAIEVEIERGDYDGVDALVHEAVHRLIEEDGLDIEVLRERLYRADAEIEHGEGSEFDEQTTRRLAEDIHARGLKRLENLPKTGSRG